MEKNTLSLIFVFLLTGFASLHPAQAVVPPPDGGYPNFTTAEGLNALKNLTTGVGNTGIGWYSLFANSSGSYNTGVGAAALLFNTTGEQNTATGVAALFNHGTGNANTAIGSLALFSDTSGQLNTAIGAGALFSNVGGPFPGSFNTATGASALASNTGGDNTATGAQALQSNTTGNDNTAVGLNALVMNTTGDHNVALGSMAGSQQTTGSHNIYIGASIAGSAGESDACYIASIFGQTSASGAPVLINSNNKLGTMTSSKRFKEEIKPMDKASNALFALNPVTFRYRKEIDPAGTTQLGLVAEDVEKVDPNLIVRDKEGKAYSVRYDQVNAMLLNEFLKEHRKVDAQKCKIDQQDAKIARLEKQIEALAAGLQKVSTQLELNKTASQTVSNDQ
jgi:hypothetical protein